ncbi:GNAT family N-acetyltransferase [Agromyces sp. MMS24-JH15]|uniref:GNAT family N-acetyltransferase n=1 Tax=Agromyces sp. MMS24-JH15 TaxID=3243765 RepID=UPI003748553E
MSSTTDGRRFEYADAAGYPDGAGFLHEGTAALVDEVTAAAVRDVDTPSADTDQEVAVHRIADRRVYSATLGEREIASILYREDGERVIVLTTIVDPDFRGRGIAGELIADVLDDIRSRGMKVTTVCPVVSAFMASNLEFSDLAS